MLKNIFIFVIIIISAAFQVSFLPHIFSAENIPDFLLILVIFWSSRLDFYKILTWIILSGIVLDAAYLAPFGLNVFSFIFIAFSLNYLSRRILLIQEIWKFFVIAGFVILGTFLNDWILLVFNWIIADKGAVFNAGFFFSGNVLVRAFYNLIIFALIYWPLVKLENFFAFYGTRLTMSK